MDIWVGVAAAALALSFLSDYGFNRIVLEGRRRLRAGGDSGEIPPETSLPQLYRAGLPPLLRRVPPLGVALEKGGSVFFFVCAVAVISAVYQRTGSFGWVLAAIPVLVAVFFASNQAAVLCARWFHAQERPVR